MRITGAATTASITSMPTKPRPNAAVTPMVKPSKVDISLIMPLPQITAARVVASVRLATTRCVPSISGCRLLPPRTWPIPDNTKLQAHDQDDQATDDWLKDNPQMADQDAKAKFGQRSEDGHA